MYEVIDRLRAAGYTTDWLAHDRRLRCTRCHLTVDPAAVTVEDIVRFEGTSDPADEAILFALSSPDGHRGLYVTAYGLDTSTADLEVITAFVPRHARPSSPGSRR